MYLLYAIKDVNRTEYYSVVVLHYMAILDYLLENVVHFIEIIHYVKFALFNQPRSESTCRESEQSYESG